MADVDMADSRASAGDEMADSPGATSFAEFANPDAQALLLALSEHAPAIPDVVVQGFLRRSGFETDDIRVQRLVGLAGQKFMAEIVFDAAKQARDRTQPGTSAPEAVKLKVEDIEFALKRAGISSKSPPYYADRSSSGTPLS